MNSGQRRRRTAGDRARQLDRIRDQLGVKNWSEMRAAIACPQRAAETIAGNVSSQRVDAVRDLGNSALAPGVASGPRNGND